MYEKVTIVLVNIKKDRFQAENSDYVLSSETSYFSLQYIIPNLTNPTQQSVLGGEEDLSVF